MDPRDEGKKDLPDEGLEIDEIPDGDIKRSGDTAEHVDAHVGGARFDLPEIRTARARHEGKLTLGYAALFAHGPYGSTQASLFALVVHPPSVCLPPSTLALYREHVS